MSFLHKSSAECAKSELDIMHTPETQAMILSGKWVDYYPISVIDGDSPIEFRVNGSAEEYTDLSQTYLYVEAKVVDSVDNALADTVVCGPVNLLLHSLFSQVDITLNDILVTSSVNTYAYRSIIETLLNYGEDSKNTHLTASLFYKDTAGQMDSVSLEAKTANLGWLKRRSIMGKSKTIDMFGRLHADIFFQDRYLLNNVEMKIRLSRQKSSFCLIGDTAAANNKVLIKKAVLYVRKARINPEVMLAHASVLEKTTAKYPIRRVETKVITLSKGLKNVIHDNITTGVIPNRVVLGLVDSDAYNGDITQNPFNFKHHKLYKVAFSIDGEETPHKSIDLNFDSDNYILGYYSLFTGVDKSVTESGNFIDRDEYKAGYTLFAYDLTADLCSGNHFNLVRNGNMRLSLSFKEPLPKAVNCIIYMEFQNMIEINKNRQILFDYTI
jgi:hypothetical protein